MSLRAPLKYSHRRFGRTPETERNRPPFPAESQHLRPQNPPIYNTITDGKNFSA